MDPAGLEFIFLNFHEFLLALDVSRILSQFQNNAFMNFHQKNKSIKGKPETKPETSIYSLLYGIINKNYFIISNI